MATYFEVKVSSLTTFEAKGSGGKKDLLLVEPKFGSLPTSLGDLVMLHEMHANRSQPMEWDKSASTFKCIHCGQVVNVSEKAWITILHALSMGDYSTFDDADVTIRFAHRLAEFSDKGVIPPSGYYAVEREES